MAFIEDAKQRLARYSLALEKRSEIVDKLEDAYRYLSPMQNVFFDKSSSERRYKHVYDSIPIESLNSFANNIQFILMPPGRQWASLVSGDEVEEALVQETDEKLQKINKILFTNIGFSNLDQVANESFKDMGISTGVILIQETPKRDIPFNFVSVSPSEVVFEQNSNGELENFWRCFKVRGQDILLQWPKAELPNSLRESINKNPSEEQDLIEGTIVYPQNKEGEQFYYYVQTKGGLDIFTEFRDYNPWLGFRFNKSPVDIWGTGPGIAMLPTISVLNQVVKTELAGAEYRVSPPFMARSDSVFNPFTAKIQPNSIIPVGEMGNIKALSNGGDPSFTQVLVEDLRRQVKEAFFSDPLGPAPTPNQSATEISIRQSNWVRKSTSSFGRLTNELLRPIVDKVLIILKKHGKIPTPVKIDNREVKIKYQSPISELQSKDEITRFQQYIQSLLQIYPPEALAGILAIPKIPFWMAEKFGIDLSLILSQEETKKIIKDGQEAQQDEQQQQVALQQIEQQAPLADQTNIVNQGVLN